jgi:hypothetical protein
MVMNEVCLPIIAYTIYVCLEDLPVSHMENVERMHPIRRRYSKQPDVKMWDDRSFTTLLKTVFLLFSRFAKWIYLIIYGVKVLWWPPIIAFFAAIPIALIFSRFFPMGTPLRLASVFILPILPILLVVLFYTLNWV